ncbi:FkbM family methyltransferase [Acinetobacter thermotolerans]|uniref:FkbM family methyltransferase n=1 Tax=Acinetobacter thermotolerans TaxID=3151487 RepID=UPI00325A9AE0
MFRILRLLNLILEYKKIIGLKGVLKLIHAKITNTQINFKFINDKLDHDVIIRMPSSDIWVLKQVFFDEEYKFKTINTPNVIVDAGANVGYASIYFSQLFPNAKILAIEPENSNYQVLCENVRKYKNIIPIQAAIWSENTKLNICDEGLGEWGFMTFSVDDSQKKVEHLVDAYSVESLIEKYDLNKIDILKIDIEGAEKEVFEDTSKWISHVDALIVELHDRMKDGCSRSFYSNTPGFNNEWTRGENVYLSKGNIKK